MLSYSRRSSSRWPANENVRQNQHGPTSREHTTWYARGQLFFRYSLVLVGQHTRPQQLLPQDRQRLGQMEHFRDQPMYFYVFTYEGIQRREVLRAFLQVRRAGARRLRIRKTLLTCLFLL
jgi:hypothetical protein